MNLIEKSVLSGICNYGEDALIDVSGIIKVESFENQTNQILYKILSEIINDGKLVDIPTIFSFAKKLGLDKYTDSNSDYISELFLQKVELSNVRQHAKSLMKKYLIRRLKAKHQEVFAKLGELSGEEKVDDILNISESAIFEAVEEICDIEKPKQIAEDSDEYFESKINSDREMSGLPTPFPKFNTLIGGGLRNGVSLIAARPKSGKSTLGKEIGLFLAEENIPVLFLDTEMAKSEQLDRCVAGYSDIDINEVETGSFRNDEQKKIKVRKALARLKEIPFYHREVYGKEFKEILSIIRRWIIKSVGFTEDGKVKKCLVIYDYFKLMTATTLDKMQEHQALGFQVGELADFCKEYHFPCLSFVQINRDGINKESSDIIAQSDRLLWLCINVSIFKRKTKEELAENEEEGNMKLIPIESRFGPCVEEGDYINLFFDKAKSKIKEGRTYFASQVKDNEYSGEEW